MDYYLKANTELELWQALISANVAEELHTKDAEGNIVKTEYAVKVGYNIDVIGKISKPTGNKILHTGGEFPIEIPEMVELEGFHANLRGSVDLAPKVEYIEYTPTEEDLNNPDFVRPHRQAVIVEPSPIQDLLVYPESPVRVWF